MEKLDLFSLIEINKLKAINSKFLPDEEFIWRAIEREYSTIFHTPLHLVSTLEPEYILLNLYEHQLNDRDLDDDRDLKFITENIYTIEDPNYDKSRDEEEEEYNRKVVEEENLKKLKKAEATKEMPKSGGINLKYLQENNES